MSARVPFDALPRNWPIESSRASCELNEYDPYAENAGEPTQHGNAPERPTDADMRGSGGGGGRDDW